MDPWTISLESVQRDSQDTSFKAETTAAHDNVPVSAWEVVLNDESKLWFGEAAAAANQEEPVEHESHQIRNHRTNEDDVIAWKVKSAVKELDTTDSWTLVDELLEDILRMLFPKVERAIRTVV